MENHEEYELTPQTPEEESVPAKEIVSMEAEPVCPEEIIPEEILQEEVIPETVVEPTAYRGSGRGRKESPYANSPYETYQPVRQEYTPGYTFQPQTQPVPKVKKVKKQRKFGGFWKKALAAVLVVALVAAGCGITAGIVNNRWEAQVNEQKALIAGMQQQMNDLQKQMEKTPNHNFAGVAATADGMIPSEVYARNVDSVVAISSTIVSKGIYGTQEGSSSGSGFILTSDGYVVTNHHVIADATKVSVITNDGTEYAATVVGSDSTNDLAVLKVEAEDLPEVVLGSSDDLIIGDMVVAIGNPLGTLNATMTVGYVSGKNREIATDNTIIDMIQTDAAINPGNSGGPLFNSRGEVVGITTAKYSGTTNSGASIEGIGFAIPVDDVMSIIFDLVDYGYVTGPYMGVSIQNMDPNSAAMYGIPVGAYVTEVVEGASADRAGIQVKDIIIALGEYEVKSITDLTRNLRHFKAGDTTTITIIRGGAKMDLTITFDERPEGFNAMVPAQDAIQIPEEGDYEEWFDYFRRYFGDE